MTGQPTVLQGLPSPASVPPLAGNSLDDAQVGTAPRETFVGRLSRDHLAVAGAVTIALAMLAAVFAPILSGLSGNDPYRYHLDVLDPTGAPAGWGGGISATHWFGVEPLTGRDLFSIVVQ